MAQHDEQARGDDIEQVGENNEVQEHGDLKEKQKRKTQLKILMLIQLKRQQSFNGRIH